MTRLQKIARIYLAKKLVIFLLLILIPLSSCTVTQKVWRNYYEETFRYFLFSTDGRFVVFLGRKYHYIFTDYTGRMKEVLSWRGSREYLFINVEESSLKLDISNKVTGKIRVESFYNRLPPRDYEFLRALGFRTEYHKGPLVLELDMVGKRYLARSDLGARVADLRRKYIIPIYYQGDFGENTLKVALTPIALAIDTVLLVGKILLLPARGQ